MFFNYRYAIYRAGVFHRWEEPSEIDGDDVDEQLSHQDNNEADSSNNNVHQIPLHLFNAGELYTVNDVLGFTVGPPDIDHIKIMLRKKFRNLLYTCAVGDRIPETEVIKIRIGDSYHLR